MTNHRLSGEGLFQTQINTVEEIFKRIGLFEERQHHPNKSTQASSFRGKSYREVYEICLRDYIYDFRLADQSLFLFVSGYDNHHILHPAFSYYECPQNIMDYKSFVEDALGMELNPEQLDDEFRIDYEDYVVSADFKRVVTPLRYDYDPKCYEAGSHPASHVHFGFSNEIRVATRRIMNPISFALFVVRQIYPFQWKLLRQQANATIWCRNVREHLDEVDDSYWENEDDMEAMLH